MVAGLVACSDTIVLELPGSAPPVLQPVPQLAPTPSALSLPDGQPVGIGTGFTDNHTPQASTPLPCLRVLPGGTLGFLGVATGKSTSRDAVVENCGTTTLVIDHLAFVGGPSMELDGLAVGESLAPGSLRTVTLRAWPTSAGPWTAWWWLRAAGVPPVAVQLAGNADLGCLVPELKLPAQVLPGAVVALDVSGSQSPTGAKVSARWTISPPGDLVPAPVLADAAKTSFVASIAGTWRVCADVRDTIGTLGCAEVCSEIDVVPDAGLHVELLWQPLAGAKVHARSPDLSDLDLHLAMAPTDGLDRDCDGTPDPWFSGHWDVWDATPAQPWGFIGSDDDGVLVVENHHGAGPEVAEVAVPSGTSALPQTYTVAVHHWDDHGNGPALAQVRIFVEGLLVAELGPQRVDPLTLWTAARVRWPNALSGGDVDAVLPCHQLGDPCDGGLRWASQGDACLDRCVIPVQSAKTLAATPAACTGDAAASSPSAAPPPVTPEP